MVGIVAIQAAGVSSDHPLAEPSTDAAWTMSTGALHTPLEELLFFQSLRARGIDAATFATISATLKANEFVRANPHFDADRLSPANLQALYLRLLKDEVRSAARPTTSPDRAVEPNRRKRKLSTPPLQSLDEAAEHHHLLPQLVDRLYARYQEQAVRTIREYEVTYDGLSKDIAAIERGEWDNRLSGAAAPNGVGKARGHDGDVKNPPQPDAQAPASHHTDHRGARSPARNPIASQSPALQAAHTPASARPPAAVAHAATASEGHATVVKARNSASPKRQSADNQARNASQTPGPAQGHTPVPPPPGFATPQPGSHVQPFSVPYPGAQPFPPYAAHGAQATMPTYPSPSPAQQAMQYAQLQRIRQGAPVGQGPQYGAMPSPHPTYVAYQPGSAFSTPHHPLAQSPASGLSRRHNLPAINTSVSTTKWKSTGPAQKSPIAPPLSPFLPSSPELSPTDASKTPIPPNRRLDEARDASTPTRGSGRRGRWAGHPTRGRNSRTDATRPGKDSPTRSQSIASHAEEPTAEAPQSRRLRGDPATPNPAFEDASTISTPASTSRPGHRRGTLRGSIDIGRPSLKRKRANTLEGSPDMPALPRPPTRPNHVLATKNFHRIVQPLMQEINSHKLASMFAKPITERDAPGYQSIIYQPQDLKTIRAAISAGSRAMQAAEKESTETGGDDTQSPAPVPGSAGGPNKSSASIWLDKSADVMPPKAIVNSAQLEKEVHRMFANAVMFNLDPHRGLGAAERRPKADDEEDDSSEEDDAEKHYEVDDGGAFVRDAREMFASVEESVSRWRSVEGGRSKARGLDESEADEAGNDA